MLLVNNAMQRQSWFVEFDEWSTLPRTRQRLLLSAVGDCGGEWWGQGKAEFWTRDAAIEALGKAAGLGLSGRLKEAV
jgi:hypothetical protein